MDQRDRSVQFYAPGDWTHRDANLFLRPHVAGAGDEAIQAGDPKNIISAG
jgi:hypothetical protein